MGGGLTGWICDPRAARHGRGRGTNGGGDVRPGRGLGGPVVGGKHRGSATGENSGFPGIRNPRKNSKPPESIGVVSGRRRCLVGGGAGGRDHRGPDPEGRQSAHRGPHCEADVTLFPMTCILGVTPPSGPWTPEGHLMFPTQNNKVAFFFHRPKGPRGYASRLRKILGGGVPSIINGGGKHPSQASF